MKRTAFLGGPFFFGLHMTCKRAMLGCVTASDLHNCNTLANGKFCGAS